MPLVTVNGFSQSQPIRTVAIEEIDPENLPPAVLVAGDSDPSRLIPYFDRIAMIVISFSSPTDGRGFSLARRLRLRGFNGHIRAQGYMICDQFRYAMECGFTDIEISDELARRQPESHWRDFGQRTYRHKLTSPCI